MSSPSTIDWDDSFNNGPHDPSPIYSNGEPVSDLEASEELSVNEHEVGSPFYLLDKDRRLGYHRSVYRSELHCSIFDSARKNHGTFTGPSHKSDTSVPSTFIRLVKPASFICPKCYTILFYEVIVFRPGASGCIGLWKKDKLVMHATKFHHLYEYLVAVANTNDHINL